MRLLFTILENVLLLSVQLNIISNEKDIFSNFLINNSFVILFLLKFLVLVCSDIKWCCEKITNSKPTEN